MRMRFGGLWPWVAPSVALVLLAACGQKSPENALVAAQEALAANDPKAAQIHLKNALAERPGFAQARFLLGKTLLKGGDPTNALVELEKAEQAGYDKDALSPVLARAMLQSRQSRPLLAKYEDVQLGNPAAQAELLTVIAMAHGATGKPEKGALAVAEALRLQPGHVGASLLQARQMAQALQIDAATQLVDKVLAKAPDEAEAWRFKADLLTLNRRDMKGASAAYAKAVQLAPVDQGLHQALITHLMTTGEKDAAKAAVEASRKQFGVVPMVRYFNGYLAMEAGDLETAHKEVEELLKNVQDDARILYFAGQVEYLRGQDLVAEKHLSKLLSMPGDASRARMLLAVTQLRMADPAKALQTLEPLLERKPQPFPRVHALAGDAYASLGQMRKAQEQYQRAVSLDPNDARSRTMMAVGQVVSGAEAQGLEQLRELADAHDSALADVALIGTLTRKGDYAGALKAIEALERKRPKAAEPALLRAQVFRAQGQTEAARGAWEEALKRDPKNLQAASQLGALDVSNKQADKAIARFAAVAKADPGNPLPAIAELKARGLAGEPADKLIASAQALVKLHPRQSRPRQVLVRLVQSTGDLNRALVLVQEAVAAIPNDADLVELQGQVLLDKRDLNQAQQVMGNLVALLPRSPDALLRLAEVEAANKNHRAALATVRKALALKPDHPNGLRAQVMLEAELGNFGGARKLAIDIGQMPAQAALGALLEGDLEAQQQNWEAAVAAYKRAVAKGGTWPALPGKLHRALSGAGKGAEAQAFAAQWLKDHPGDVALRAYLGDSALARGEWAQARGHYEAVLQGTAAARDAGVLNNLAWVMLRQGAVKEALPLAREAAALRPQSGAVQDTLAEVLSANGEHDAAIETQRRAVGLEPDNASRKVALARRYIDAGQKPQARETLEGVARLGDKYPAQAEVRELLKGL